MDITEIILNLSYLLIVVALLLRDILYLRSIIIFSEIAIIIYGVIINNYYIAGWNILFCSINIVQVTRLLIERKPIVIPPHIIDLHENIFSELTGREFLYFWNMGKITEADDVYLCRSDEIQKELLLILNGKVSVIKDNNEITQLSRGRFVAEMSFLTEEPASADVKSMGKIEYISWSQEKIRNLKQINHNLLMKLQLVLGKDLSHKLKDRLKQ